MERKIIILLLAPFLLFWHWFEPTAKKNQQGIKAYEQQKYEEALELFMSAKGLDPEMAELKNNTATVLYHLNKYKEALDEFSQINPEDRDIRKPDFYYNLGNSFFKTEQYAEALKYYKKSLLEDPMDIDTKKNYELTLKKLEDQKNNKEEQQDQQNQKQDDQKEEDKYKNIMQYLNQNEKQQLEKKKRKIGIAVKEKDW